ncbi:MAG: ribonuclease R [Bacillota bacterium]
MKKRKNVSEKLRDRIHDALKNHKQKSLALPQILDVLGLQKHDKSIVLAEIKKMIDDGLLIKTGSGRYGLPERLGYVTGVLEGNRRGFAFLRPDRQEEDVFISPDHLKNAAHGDRVVVELNQKKRGKRRREGTVIGIIKRGQRRLVGTLQRKGKKYYVIPDDQRYPGEIQVSGKNLKQVEPGDKVIVEVEEWVHGRMPSRGRVVEHLGSPGSIQTERLAFKHRYELPGEHPENVLKEVETLPGEDDIARQLEDPGRRDLRDLTMVTIDDETAKDFDDAVSLEDIEGGALRLGVHIADVSHYVRSGKPLNREALKRGTSIYLVDRVIHMLPPALSENLCSLRAGKDRLAVSVFMDIDSSGELVDADYTTSLIRVAERLTYQQVEAYLKKENDEKVFKDQAVPGMIARMDRLAAILRQRRTDRGTLDLDLPEAKIKTDDQGNPVSIEKRTMGRSESLIEEFMIYCNETVASYLTENEVPCVYRVHAVPTEEKLQMLRETLTLMNIKAAKNIKVLKPKHLKKLLEETKGELNERLVRYLILRSLPQARYSATNEGHFGLASKCYCHFTSPIRRYPDLMVHRILKEQLSSGITPEKISRLQTRLPGIAEQASERERAAIEAERASIDIKKAQYMEQKIGEIYTGIINGVANFGIFVELDNTVEGMIPIGELGDDYFFYNEKAASLTGERTRKNYRLGDIIDVQVVRANRDEGKVTFAPAPTG